MAKTRIKMTPLRKSSSSKGLLLNSNGGTVITGGGVGGGGVTGSTAVKSAVANTTIEILESPTRHAEKTYQAKKTITSNMTVPHRSHSISSSASSDVQSINSDYEVSLPLSALEDSQNGLNRLENSPSKKRKLYLITEKSDETNSHTPETNGLPKKRKMFVVVEQNKETAAGNKLMIMTDKPQANLTQHLKTLLPEILHHIQDKEQKQIKPTPVVVKAKPVVNNPRPHITLPPKKNPTNFVKITPTPSPVPSPQMPNAILNTKIAKPDHFEEKINSEDMETNINLSPDFRFLMKILPKLEQLPEPHKQNVKRSIQIFVDKSYSIYGNKD
ncbi:uncharacterized protein LOC108109798 isoform X2 [Drosophila eugracilis]|nr:uncharacterized protein LOC108109798 isoform X2 [Drosophila eugracilis]